MYSMYIFVFYGLNPTPYSPCKQFKGKYIQNTQVIVDLKQKCQASLSFKGKT
jgi:hypothetical protein